jgi:hypothetical protein
LCGMGARAQRIEVFTGFSYGQFNPGANLTQTLRPFGRHFSMPGLEASGQLNCAAQAGHQDNYRAAAGFVWHF